MTSSTIIEKLTEEKISKFNEEMKNFDEMEKKIMDFLIKEYEEIFPEILIMSKKQFLLNVKKGANLTLEDLYTNKIKENQKFQSLFEDNFKKIEEKYDLNHNLLKNKWADFKKNKNEPNYLLKYRKHCFYDSDYASHNCSNKDTKFILISSDDNNDNIEFVICSNCLKTYKSSFILCKCFYCDEEYYSEILPKHHNIELFLATWKEYHCPSLISSKMPCIKCKSSFYLNMKTGMLNCINPKCKFISEPHKILWTCNICKTDFRSDAIVYNPLDKDIIQNAIKQTLLLKHRAHPDKMPCCKLNIFFTEFYHKKSCRGILYLGEINDKLIVVCEKCKAINYYERFIWTCPKCKSKFRALNEDASKLTNNAYEQDNYNSNNIYLDINDKKDKSYRRGMIEKEKKDNKEISNKDKIIDRNDISDNKTKNRYKDDDVQKILRKSSLKAVIDSPLKKRSILKNNKNSSQGFRRHFRIKTQPINFSTPDEGKNNNTNESSSNQIQIQNENNNSNPLSNYKGLKREKTQVSRFKIPEELEEENQNENEENKNEKIENENNKPKFNQKLIKLKTTENVIGKKKSVFMRYKKKKLENSLKVNDEEETKNEEKNNQEKNRKNSEENNDDFNNEKSLKTERDYNEKNNTNEKENKAKKKGIFSRFLFVGNSPKKSNFKGRHNMRRSSVQDYNINKKIKERITGDISPLDSSASFSSSSSSSSSSSFSKRLNKIKNHTKKKKAEEEIREDKENENKSIKENNKNSTNEISNEFEENKLETLKINKIENLNEENIKNNCMDEDKESLDEEESDETKGVLEDDNKNTNSTEEGGVFNFLQNPGINDNSFNQLSKKINQILASTKIAQFNLEDYTISKRIGEGSYGVIHCLRNEKTKEKFALKKIITYSLKKIQEFTKEFELVHICQHPNILKIYGLNISILDQTTYSLQVLMEKADRDWDRDIKKRLQERKYYTEEELISIMRQLTSALLFLKEKLNITHRDIKPQNILIFAGDVYKLADFGEAKEIKLKKNLNTLRGTELYMSPALFNGLKVNRTDIDHDPFKSDLFSLGFCFVYAATMNFNLLYELRNINDDKKIRKKIKENLKENYSEKFIEIISKMVELEEKNRIDFKDLSKEIEKNYGK